MSAATTAISSLVSDAMTKEGIHNYKLDISGSSSKGDGYLGEICFVKVTPESENGKKKIYDMVIKTAKSNEDIRNNSPLAETYIREIRTYTEIFPAIEALQKEFAVENYFKNYPKCYVTCKIDKKEALVFENLKSLGFEVHDRTVSQNFEHALFVFQNYARWHGSSLALKSKRPEIFKSLTSNMSDIMGKFVTQGKMGPVMTKYFQKGIDLLKKNGKEDYAEKIQKYSGDITQILTTLTLNDDKEAEVEAAILHGDCWNNNMMFKYKENDASKPDDIIFIDFQLARLASPILDLSYYLYATCEKATLDKFDYLLEEYHKELTNYLQQYNIDCDDILTLKRLKSSWKKYGRFGLAMSSFIIRTALCHEDEVVDFTEKIGDGTMEHFETGDIKLQKEYEKRLYDIFHHFVEKFL